MAFKPAKKIVLLMAMAATPVFAQNLATVNGKPVPSSRADLMVKQITAQNNQPDTPDLRNAIKDELINREVLVQEAEKEGLGNSPDVKAQYDIARQSILIRALVANYVKKNPVSEDLVKTEYDKFKSTAGDKEYHVRHILVESEAEANAIIAKLKSGTKFEELAKQSKDPGSANNGGDLSWATPVAFVKPFSDAMTQLKPGQYTETPVKTQFGYHVIRVDEVRAAKIPTMAELHDQIVQTLQERKLQAYQSELRAKAKVQ